LSFWGAIVAASALSAAEASIEAKTENGNQLWQPKDTSASVGDVIEWKLDSGTHGVRITNWADVKGHVDVEMVAGQQPFNATTGRNDNSTNTAGKVLLRIKLKSVPAAPAEIKFNCIVHGAAMNGTVTVAAAATTAPKSIEGKSANGDHLWQPKDTTASVGDVIEWKLGNGTHGVRITNWAVVKGHVDVETVAGQQPFNATTGRNDNSTNTPGKLLLRVKIKSVPAAPAEITFNCIVHGAPMNGKVSISPADQGSDMANLKIVQDFFSAFGKGDIPGVLNTLSEDVDWFIPGPATIPYAGQRKGKEEVGKFFVAFSDAVEVKTFEPREFITQKDKLVVIGHEELKVKTTAKDVKNEWVLVFTIEKDKIKKFRSYEDTAALVDAFAK
jgi:ketosteroid isomerase-like protein/plastocyanin